MSIYKPCDIRGRVAADLSSSLYEAWGRSLGGQLSPGAKFVVGGDVRESTPAFLAALVEGLCQTGLDVVNLGLLPTPMIYYGCRRLAAAGCAIVTASHNPASINGLKWMIGDRPPSPADVSLLSPLAPATPASSTQRGGAGQGGVERRPPRELDISFDYVAHLQETFVDARAAQFHLVIDPMHGCWAGKVRRYLHAVFPQCIFSTIHDDPDPQFAGRAPDCSRHELLDELSEAIYRQRARGGLAFDGDGDRVALIDGNGIAFSPEEAAFAVLQCYGDALGGERFVHDVKFSDRIAEEASRLGAEPTVERSGHAFLRARMVETGALLGAEASGHYFHRALGGGDDALYTACLLMATMARTGRSLADMRRACPAVAITPDLRVSVDDGEHAAVIEQIRLAWADFPQKTTDGLRIDTPGGWALVRSSVTEPALTFRFEGLDRHALEDLVERFCDTLPDALADTLWLHCQDACGFAQKDEKNRAEK